MTRTIEVALGLGFGDEGKGTIVDWLARRARTPPLIVRWNGGPQAAHHVVTADGRTHCFAQFGAGMFVPGARTHLGPDMAIDPYALGAEAAALAEVGVGDARARLTIDPRAIVVTPWHAIVNQIRELVRGGARHGTTGRGVAEAKLGAHTLVAGQLTAIADALGPVRGALIALAEQLAAQPGAPEQARVLAARASARDLDAAFGEAVLAMAGVRITAAVPAAAHVILESAQGALLDREHGFAPHVTPSRITRVAAEAALRALALAGEVEVWGVLRAVHTRHGAGPFPSADAALTAQLPEPHNPDHGWAGRFRVGWFDAVLARHALACAGPIDRLAITCLDRVAALPARAIAIGWQRGDQRIEALAPIAPGLRTEVAFAAAPILREVDELESAIADVLDRPIDLTSWGPTADDKRPRLV